MSAAHKAILSGRPSETSLDSPLFTRHSLKYIPATHAFTTAHMQYGMTIANLNNNPVWQNGLIVGVGF